MKSFVIGKLDSNKNIEKVILKKFPHIAINTINKAFRKKDIKVNKITVTKDYITKEGDIVILYIKEKLLYGIYDNILVSYEDENILICYKPRGIISCRGEENKNDIDNIFFDEVVKEKIEKDAIICHRLDTNTEGLVIFSKNITAEEEILKAFKDGTIDKYYTCLVYSKPEKDYNTVEGYIIEDNKTSFSKVYDKKIKNSSYISTSYELLEYIKNLNVSILKVKIHTGKMHQIRAHMKYLKTPIIGDSKYTPQNINKKFKLKYQVLYASSYNFNFNESDKLYYLNNKTIDISENVIKKIHNLVDNYT